MSKLKGDTMIGVRLDGSRLLNDGGKRAIERLRTNEALEEEIIELKRLNGVKDARIDELMLEYCPHEMTKEQIENWEKHQVKSEIEI